ncbi:MAG: 5-(carboxyamino)imidazole ribonucleotide mutase [Clostridia bacterium]|nr:5-(carboxyamino)imidazole ribonucleotide mutase [Clostridia bacterium]
MKCIAIVMGSKSDLNIAKKAIKILDDFDAPYAVRVISAHRSPIEAIDFARNAYDNGFGAIIAIAGKAAHLGGVLASSTALPVIGVPVSASELDGMDALLSTVQMPSGVPVATVAINGGANSALLALQMLAIDDQDLYNKLVEYKEEMSVSVQDDDDEIRQMYVK